MKSAHCSQLWLESHQLRLFTSSTHAPQSHLGNVLTAHPRTLIRTAAMQLTAMEVTDESSAY